MRSRLNSADSADILLVFPPFWDTASPYLSIPTLAAWLRQAGVAVEAVDLNLRCTEGLLTPSAMEGSLLAAERVLRGWDQSRTAGEREEFAANLALCRNVWAAAGDKLLAQIPAGAAPRAPRTIDDYTALRRRLGWAFSIASAPYHPMRLKLDGLSGTDSLTRLSTVCDLAQVESGAPGLQHVAEFARDQAARGIPLLGLSVAGPSQLVPALLLARIFKERSPSTFICIGGPQVPYIAEALRRYDRPFEWVDAFVPGEGELPLTELSLAIREGRDPLAVRGLLVRRGGVVVSTGSPGRVDVTALPPPDFTGFEPWRYLGNDGCVPLTFARGCSWGRCSFCTQHICFDGYRAMSPGQVEAHIRATVERYGLHALAINDENLTPKRLRELASVVNGGGRRVHWQALARLAPQLARPALARELADAGCIMLSMGLESGDQGVLDLNRKGIRARMVPAILRTLHDAGIWLNAFLIFGLPGETPETALQTIDFVARNRSCLDSISPTVFRVERGSPIASLPTAFGIEVDEVTPDHCDSEIPIRSTAWLTKPEAMVCLETLVYGLVGAPQCPIEQADLNGQFVLQMLAAGGVGAVRAEMERRAAATRAAADLLETDSEALRAWWAPIEEQAPDDDADNRVILSLADRGTFFTLTPSERWLLRLRALGLPLDRIQQGFGALISDETERAGMTWGVAASMLLLLSSRLLQESLARGAPIGVTRLYGGGADHPS